MDTQKDIKRHIEKVSLLLKTNNMSLITESLKIKEKKEYFRIFKKTEKIVTAIMILGDLVDPGHHSELIISLNRYALASFDTVTSLMKTTGSYDSEIYFQTYIISLESLLATLRMSVYMSLVSEGNYILIKNEIENIQRETREIMNASRTGFITKTLHRQYTDTTLGAGFFETEFDHVAFQDSRKTHESSETLKGHKGQENVSENVFYKSEIIENIKDIDKGQVEIKKTLSETKGMYEKKSDRQEMILDILKKHTNVTINDLSVYLKSLSPKTIQREINKMIDQGIVHREGNKRWSSYSLKKV